MNQNQLGQTEIKVSELCLGTMTYGAQNSQQDAFAQLDYAQASGINFIDTAEMYSVPTSPDTYGRTEEIIGNWLEARMNREDVVLATKVAGPSRIKHIRGGKARLDKENITSALEGSLKRLKTDYIDLYQLHWPDRKTNFFGSLAYEHDETANETPLEETLLVLADLVAEGKIRAIGLSNETAWGVMKCLQIADNLNLDSSVRVASIQNPYSLLNRSFELNLAEVAHREQVSLLAYSPLAFGTLTGKYLNNPPTDARCSLFKEFKRYFTPSAIAATHKYAQLADQAGLSPARLALAFVNQQTFVTSNIIGATTMPQLKENIAALNDTLSVDVINEINRIHAEHTYPAP
jgi:aryl-alcohol dehydrogenase-like predicted oxidoreductase